MLGLVLGMLGGGGGILAVPALVALGEPVLVASTMSLVIVPALVSAMGVPIKRATATALVVIVINSAVALVVRHGNLGPAAHTVALAAATGDSAVVGALVSHRIPGWLLSAAFGVLMVAVAVFTVTRAVVGA